MTNMLFKNHHPLISYVPKLLQNKCIIDNKLMCKNFINVHSWLSYMASKKLKKKKKYLEPTH